MTCLMRLCQKIEGARFDQSFQRPLMPMQCVSYYEMGGGFPRAKEESIENLPASSIEPAIDRFKYPCRMQKPIE